MAIRRKLARTADGDQRQAAEQAFAYAAWLVMSVYAPEALRELHAAANEKNVRGRRAIIKQWPAKWRIDANWTRKWARGVAIAMRIVGPRAYVLPLRGSGFGGPAAVVDDLDAQDVNQRRADDPSIDPLAPIGANPLIESREIFAQRAQAHWDARAAVARSAGAVDALPDRDAETLALHCYLTALVRIKRLSSEEAARSAGEHSDASLGFKHANRRFEPRALTSAAVRAAVSNMEALLNLAPVEKRTAGRPTK